MKQADNIDRNQHPPKSQHMVSASAYYRQRADIQRGLRKRDYPSVEEPSEKTSGSKVKNSH